MVQASTRFANLLRDGIIGLIFGAALSIIAIVPDVWLSIIQKIMLSLGIIGALVIAVSIKVFYEDMKQYLDAKREVDDYFELMPKIIRFTRFDRIIHLKENGDADVQWIMRLQNLSTDDIACFTINFFLDIYDPTTPTQSSVKVNLIRIDTYEVQCPQRCYENVGIITRANNHQEEQGHFSIPFNEVGGLKGIKKGKQAIEKEVRIDFKALGVFKKLYEASGEYYNQAIYHPTSIVEITVYAPDGSNILVNATTHHPNGIEVHDIVSKVVDFKEMSAVTPPKANRSDVVSWTIKNPKLTYSYRLNFKCLKNVKKVEDCTKSST